MAGLKRSIESAGIRIEEGLVKGLRRSLFVRVERSKLRPKQSDSLAQKRRGDLEIGCRTLQPWVEDVVEQLALGQLLHTSSNASVRRIALIVIDNAVEVTLKTYVEFEKRIEYFGLKRSKWEADYKQSFKEILRLVIAKTGVQVDENLILGYHDTRNQLYHDPKLLTIEASDLAKYLKQGKALADQLYSLSLNDTAWSEIARALVASSFPRADAKPKITVVRKEDGSMRVNGVVGLGDTDAVAIVTQRMLDELGKVPSFKELRATLRSSGKSPSNLSDCIGRLRSRGVLKKNELALTPQGQKEYAKYL